MPYRLVPQRYVDLYADVDVEELCKRPNIPAADTKMGKYYRNNIKYYYGMITGVDEQFGRILESLKQQGLDDNTIVVFTSDHGNCLGIHNMVSKNNRYEESMRVPFMIRYPGRIEARRDEMLFSGLDMCPTLIELTTGKDNIPADMDGESFAEQFLTGKGERPKWQWYMWTPPEDATAGRRGIRNTEYTFVVSKAKDKDKDKAQNKPNEYYLHDNVNDPYQLKNIAGENPVLVKELTGVLEKMLRKYDDPWLENV